MKVLVWVHGFQARYAGPYFAKEAKRQGFEVRVIGSITNPSEMLATFREYKPDFVFCFVINLAFKKYYDVIKRTGTKLIFWYPDMTDSIRNRTWQSLEDIADVLIFSQLETAQRYKNLAPIVLWMPQYFDHVFCSENGQLPMRLNTNEYIYDLCFIGSCDMLRSEWLDELEKKYKCFFARDGIKYHREIRGQKMTKIYAQSKIAINIQRKLYTNTGPYVVSNRIYNAIGSGAFFLNHPVQHLDLVFKEGVDCVSYNDTLDDLLLKIDYYLKHGMLRERIALQGQQNVLQHHTLNTRIKEYWQVMQAIHENRMNELSIGEHNKWVRT